MAESLKHHIQLVRQEIAHEAGIEKFRAMGEHYKVKILEDIPKGETLCLQGQGDFINLCRGLPMPSTRKLTAFKLIKLAGAYWRGNFDNEMLRRVSNENIHPLLNRGFNK